LKEKTMWREKHDMSEQQVIEHQKRTGGYNAFPPKWREISEAEFAKSRHFTFHPVLVEFRQMIKRDERGSMYGVAVSATLHWQNNGTGFAIVNDPWAGKVKFYTFGEVPAGFVETFDSSD